MKVLRILYIEEGITKVGNYAFGKGETVGKFGELTTVSLANSVTEIGVYAFSAADKLTHIVLGEESQLQKIGESAFNPCSSFADMGIIEAKNLKTICPYAFYRSGFQDATIVLPPTITSYDSTSLGLQSNLILFYPKGLDGYYEHGYAGLEYTIENNKVKITKIQTANAKQTISLPDTILGYPIVAVNADRTKHTIDDHGNHYMVDRVCQLCGHADRCGENVFYEYSDGVLTLFGSGAMTDYSYTSDVPWYSYAGNITKVVIAKGIISIGKNAFYGASSLVDIELEENSLLTKIGMFAFEGCISLADTDIFEDARITTIEKRAFKETGYKGTIVLPATLTDIDEDSFTDMTTTVLILPAELGDLTTVGAYMGYKITGEEATITTFKNNYFIKTSTFQLPEKIDGKMLVAVTATHENIILEHMTHNIVNHTCIICGYTTKCGENVFYSFEDGVIRLSGTGDMFNYTGESRPPWNLLKNEITEVIVGKDITSIGDYAFMDCPNIERLVFEQGATLETIGKASFLRDTGLSDVVIPETVTSMIGAFQSCSNATIYYPETATIHINSFIGAKDVASYRMVGEKRYITNIEYDYGAGESFIHGGRFKDVSNGTVTLENWTYGETANEPVPVSLTHKIEN